MIAVQVASNPHQYNEKGMFTLTSSAEEECLTCPHFIDAMRIIGWLPPEDAGGGLHVLCRPFYKPFRNLRVLPLAKSVRMLD